MALKQRRTKSGLVVSIQLHVPVELCKQIDRFKAEEERRVQEQRLFTARDVHAIRTQLSFGNSTVEALVENLHHEKLANYTSECRVSRVGCMLTLLVEGMKTLKQPQERFTAEQLISAVKSDWNSK